MSSSREPEGAGVDVAESCHALGLVCSLKAAVVAAFDGAAQHAVPCLDRQMVSAVLSAPQKATAGHRGDIDTEMQFVDAAIIPLRRAL